MGLPVIERSILINAPVERVFQLQDDPSLAPQVMVGLERVYDISRSEGRVGDTARFVFSVLGVPMEGRMTVLEWEANRKVVTRMEGALEAIFTSLIEPAGTGTRLTWRMDYKLKGGVFGRALNALMVQRMNERNLERSLENAKRVCETPG